MAVVLVVPQQRPQDEDDNKRISGQEPLLEDEGNGDQQLGKDRSRRSGGQRRDRMARGLGRAAV